jgi:hypothetical protein
MPNGETPQQLFERAARALCPGQAWQAALSDLAGVRRDTVRGWVSGHLTLRPDHFSTLLSLIIEKRAELAKIEVELRQWLSKQPREDQP